MTGLEDSIHEQVGGARRRSAAATPTCASPEGHHHSTQNALIKSLLNKLRLSGSKLKHEKFEKFNFSIPATGGLDTPLNQGKQVDQRNGRLSTGASPFEHARVLPPSQRPSPTAHTPTTSTPLDPNASGSAKDLLPSLGSTSGSGSLGGLLPPLQPQSQPQPHQPLNAQRSLEAALAVQQSWGSPRLEAFKSNETGIGSSSSGGMATSTGGSSAAEPSRPSSSGQPPLASAGSDSGLGASGLALGSLHLSLGGGLGTTSSRKIARPSNVPPLDFSRLASRDDGRRSRRPTKPDSPSPSSAAGRVSTSGVAPPPPLTPHQYQQQLQESLADMDEELELWLAPPRWNPSSQGRWYLYPPIGRKDVSPVEQLVESLAPSQAAAVVLLWRQYAAARYSAELMAGRAVRLCRELSHELSESRAEVDERTQRHADHAAQLGKAIMRLQQQLEEARRAAAAATQAAAQAAAQAQAVSAGQGPSSATDATGAAGTTANAATNSNNADPHPHHQHNLRQQLSRSLPGAINQGGNLFNGSSPARGGSSRTAAPSPALSREGSVRGSGSAAGGVLAQLLAREKEKGDRVEREKKLMSGRASGRPAGAGRLGCEGGEEGEDLAMQLEQMRALFLEAHEDSRALREALIEVDEQNMQLFEQSNGLRRHAAAVLKENDALRQEVAQLRTMLTSRGGASVQLSAGGGDAAAGVVSVKPISKSNGGKSSSIGSSGGGGGAETGPRLSLSGEYGSSGVTAAGATPPPRRPPTSAVGSNSTAGAMTPTSAKIAQQFDFAAGGVSRTSARRISIGYGPGDNASAAPPLPPSRISARPGAVSQRGPSASSGGRSAKEVPLPMASQPAGAAPPPPFTPLADSKQGTSSGSDVNGGGAAKLVGISSGDRGMAASRVASLSDAVAADGAVVVVQASRRAPSSSGVVQAPLRVGVAASGVSQVAISVPSSAGALARKTVGSNDGGNGIGGSGGGSMLQQSVEERLLKAQAAVAQARAAMAAAAMSSSQF